MGLRAFILLLLILSAPASAGEEGWFWPPDCNQVLMSVDFDEVELVEALRVVAKAMDRHIFVGPGVSGTVTLKLQDVPPGKVLRRLLRGRTVPLDYRVFATTVVVAQPVALRRLDDPHWEATQQARIPEKAIRQEFVLEFAPSDKVRKFFDRQYDEVWFFPHPSMNGFIAVGSKTDILQIKRELPRIDKAPRPPMRRYLSVENGSPLEKTATLSKRLPGADFHFDERLNAIVVEGPREEVETATRLLEKLDTDSKGK